MILGNLSSSVVIVIVILHQVLNGVEYKQEKQLR